MARIAVFYHFLHPDPVISSILFSELSADLAERGWEVEGYCCNRTSGSGSGTYRALSVWNKVKIHRIWRPGLAQSSSRGRILNAVWMILAWSLIALKSGTPDVILMGTDPILSVLIAPVWRLLRPKTRIVHWCFDLYPEAAYADGILFRDGVLSRILRHLLKPSYRACDLIVDIGSCMRELLGRYTAKQQQATLVPWALSEPPSVAPVPINVRHAIFGQAKLALMYSGTMGRAHSFEDLLVLVRGMRDARVHLAFSVQGNRETNLRQALSEEDRNISLIPFASAADLELRLAAADIHVVSLHPAWTGTVVPSKFFGALAVGRPVLFCGSRTSGIARWIEQYEVGWVLEPGCASQVAMQITAWGQDEQAVPAMRIKCQAVYSRYFSKKVTTQAWHDLLTGLLS